MFLTLGSAKIVISWPSFVYISVAAYYSTINQKCCWLLFACCWEACVKNRIIIFKASAHEILPVDGV